MRKALVLYHYYEVSDEHKKNLQYFLEAGYDDELDYIIIIAGGCTINLPIKSNILYEFQENCALDYGGFAFAVNTLVDVGRYTHFIFVNCSVRGPFLPPYYRESWVRPFTDMLSGDVKLVGSSINIMDENFSVSKIFEEHYDFAKPFSHVQSMVYAMDRPALQFLMDGGFFDRRLGLPKFDIIAHYEVLMSQFLIQHGWN